MPQFKVTTFYQFCTFSPEKIDEIKNRFEKIAEQHSLKGLVILGKEGFNSTSAGPHEGIEALKDFVQKLLIDEGAEAAVFKDSYCDFLPFKIFKVKVRPEIVTLGDETVLPEDLNDATHLDPDEWDELLNSPNSVCIDTRNWYENEMGMFKGAIDPKIDTFQEFREFVEKQDIDRDKDIMLYCTGGIRCEKAVPDLKKLGFKNVYQLKGGILNYIQKKPNRSFEGECFVFDNRVAVTQELQPTKSFKLCPHCGQPAKEKIECDRCDTHAMVCHRCLEKEASLKSCSKNCAYQLKVHPGRKGPRQTQGFRVKMQDS